MHHEFCMLGWSLIASVLLQIGQDDYRQIVGIPQGSVLSSLLCSFFYGDLEKNTLRSVMDSESGILLRLIDDYLYITTEETDARYFLEVMGKGEGKPRLEATSQIPLTSVVRSS